MAEAPKAEIPSVRIAQDVPVIFGDAIGSQSFGFGVVKMYLTRYDPDPGLIGPTREVTVCQIVMPVENFVRTVSFLEFRMNQMVQLGEGTRRTLRKLLAEEEAKTAKEAETSRAEARPAAARLGVNFSRSLRSERTAEPATNCASRDIFSTHTMIVLCAESMGVGAR